MVPSDQAVTSELLLTANMHILNSAIKLDGKEELQNLSQTDWLKKQRCDSTGQTFDENSSLWQLSNVKGLLTDLNPMEILSSWQRHCLLYRK